MNITQSIEEKKRTVNTGADVSAPIGGGLNATLGWELTKSVEKTDRGTLIGLTRIEGKFNGPSVKNAARWILSENHSQSDGLPSYLRTAILLKRKNNQQFEAGIKVQAEVDMRYSVTRSLRRFAGAKVDPIIFDPTVGPLGDTLVPVNLENLSATQVDKLCALRSTTAVTTTTKTYVAAALAILFLPAKI